jgi:hypothetical protein
LHFAIAVAGRYIGRMPAKPQFSLRTIFVLTVLAALVAAEAAGFPDWLADIVGWVVTSLLPPAVMAGIVYARGPVQAFWIGACVWWLTAFVMLFLVGMNTQILDGGRLDICLYWLMGVAGGLVAVFIRWLSVRNRATSNGRGATLIKNIRLQPGHSPYGLSPLRGFCESSDPSTVGSRPRLNSFAAARLNLPLASLSNTLTVWR